MAVPQELVAGRLPAEVRRVLNAARVELEDFLDTAVPWLDGCLGSLALNEGKLLRPTLCILAAMLSNPDAVAYLAVRTRLARLAAAIEALHVGTLIHDDIVDQSPTRRGRPAAHVRWDNATATWAGGLIMLRSMRVLSTLEPRIHREATRLAHEIVTGQLAEFRTQYYPERSYSEYLSATRQKTAALFAFASWAGAIVVHASEETANKLRRLGRYFGVAFQVADDVVDGLRGESGETDADKGVYTLPTFVRASGRNERSWRAGRAERRRPRSPHRALLARYLSLVRYYVSLARRVALEFPRSAYRSALLELCEFPEAQVRRAFPEIHDERSA